MDNGTIRLNVVREDLLRGVSVVVRDIMGRAVATIHHGDLTFGEQTFDVPSSLTGGMYVVSIETDASRIASPFVISR
jgi:hypothetical protein